MEGLQEINQEQEKFVAEQVAKSLRGMEQFFSFYLSKYGDDPLLREAIIRLRLLKNINYEYILTKYKDE